MANTFIPVVYDEFQAAHVTAAAGKVLDPDYIDPRDLISVSADNILRTDTNHKVYLTSADVQSEIKDGKIVVVSANMDNVVTKDPENGSVYLTPANVLAAAKTAGLVIVSTHPGNILTAGDNDGGAYITADDAYAAVKKAGLKVVSAQDGNVLTADRADDSAFLDAAGVLAAAKTAGLNIVSAQEGNLLTADRGDDSAYLDLTAITDVLVSKTTGNLLKQEYGGAILETAEALISTDSANLIRKGTDNRIKVVADDVVTGGNGIILSDGKLKVQATDFVKEDAGLAVSSEGKIYFEPNAIPKADLDDLTDRLGIREWLTADRDYYVDAASGVDDEEHGVVTAAWKSLDYALEFITRYVGVGAHTVKVHVANGAYPAITLGEYARTTGHIEIVADSTASFGADNAETLLCKGGYWVVRGCTLKSGFHSFNDGDFHTVAAVRVTNGAHLVLDGFDVSAFYLGDADARGVAIRVLMADENGILTVAASEKNRIIRCDKGAADGVVNVATTGGIIEFEGTASAQMNCTTYVYGDADDFVKCTYHGKFVAESDSDYKPSFQLMENKTATWRAYTASHLGLIMSTNGWPKTDAGVADAESFGYASVGEILA